MQTGQTIPGYLLPLEGEAATATAVRGGLRGLATVPMLAGFHFTFLFPAGREGTVFEFGAQMRAAVKQAKADVVRAGRSGYASPNSTYQHSQASLTRRDLSSKPAFQEILHQARAKRRQDALRVELHAHNRIFRVLQRHDLTLISECGHFQALWHRLFFHDQTVVACRLERAWQPRK